MSDLQVQDPYTTQPKSYKYEPQDRQQLLDLLHEYSDKLISLSRELDTKNDIQVQDPYTTRPKFYKYEPEDRQLLVDLLHEYSDKLIAISRELDIKRLQVGSRAKFARFIDLLFKTSFYTTGISLTLICLVALGLFSFSKYQAILSGRLESSDITAVLFLSIVAVGAIIVVLQASKLKTITISKKIARSIYLLDKDARMIADKLEKVMRVTIEIQDQIETNLARKLELDMRIADARSALEYYYSIVESK